MRLAAALLLLAAPCVAPCVTPCAAQDRPVTAPTRDVDVVYRAGLGDGAVQQRSRFRAADQKLRLDTPSPGLYAIVDQQAHTMAMVSDGDQGVIDMRLPGGAVPGTPPPGTSYVRLGADTVAGLPCTEWQTQDNRGQPTVACFTPDGVLLRARQGAAVLVVATRVSYGPQDPAVFAIPPAYKHVTR